MSVVPRDTLIVAGHTVALTYDDASREYAALTKPRVVALIIALPVLTFLGSMAALLGGELVAWFYGGMSPTISRVR